MRDGECGGSVIGRYEWDLYSQELGSNPNCDLVLTGTTVETLDGAL